MTPEENAKQIAEIKEGLGRIGPVGRAVGKTALSKGAKVLADVQRFYAPIGKPRKGRKPGALRKAIRSRGLKAKERLLGAKAGIEVGQKPGSGSAPHGHLVADGTEQRATGQKSIWQGKKQKRRIISTGKKAMNRGRVTPNRFIKRALAAAQPAVTQTIIAHMKQGIENAIKKEG